MLERIVEISDIAKHLCIENKLLKIECRTEDVYIIPLEEIAVLLLSNPKATLSYAVLARLSAAGAMVVCCDNNYLPVGIMQPLQSHYEQTARLATQVEVGMSVKKQAWKQVVMAKLASQAYLLNRVRLNGGAITQLIKEVKSDDSTNIEARAARIYWSELALFPQRNRQALDANQLLNYGYAILHSCCARALCSVGLHPSLGLHHCNGYNPFVLASDLMEPYRVLIDEEVILLQNSSINHLDKETKARLIGAILNGKVLISGKQEQLFRALQLTAESLVRVYQGLDTKLQLPNYE